MCEKVESDSLICSTFQNSRTTLDVLLVEDSPPDAIFVKTLLEKGTSGKFNVVWCPSLKAGISMMECMTFDAILLDLGLPDSFGLDTIKAVVECAHCPIIVLSGLSNEEIAIQAVQIGAQDYLMKSELSRRNLERSIRYAAERYQMVESLMKAKMKLEAANRVKNEFLSIMSHGFRTPMNGIVGGLDLLKSESLSDDVREIHDMMSQCAHNQVRLIDDVLVVSQAQGGAFELNEKAFLLHDFILAAVEVVSTEARVKHLNIGTSIESDIPPVIFADEGRLRQVLVSLLENAVRYSDDGHISLMVSRSEIDELVFSVSDQGVGIKEDELEEVFNVFTQFDTSPSRRFVGSGIGLAVSKRLVELMGGVIQVRSKVGEGSVFSFSLKFRKPNLPHAIEHPELIEDHGSEVLLAHKFPLGVLVVDESESSTNLMTGALVRLGYEPVIAYGAAEAIEMVSAKRYDLIFVDLSVEGIDGKMANELILEKVKLNPLWGLPYIVAVTANVDREDRRECMDRGMRALLEKPIEVDDLRGIVESAFGFACCEN